MDEVLAVTIALAASFCVNYSSYLQKKAVDALPKLRLRISWTVIRTFFTNRPWLAAMAMDAVGTALFMVALIFAPVSIVEPIITAGIALLAYLAIKNLGEKPGWADFCAIGMTALGVIFLAVSLAEGVPKEKSYHPLELWVVVVAAVVLAIALPLSMYLFGRGNIAAGLGVSGGLIIGTAAVFSRLLMGNFGGQWYIWLAVCAVTYPLGFALFQAGLQRGRAVVVAPVYNALVVSVPIAVGTVALNESLPESELLTALRVAAFVLIVVGTIVLSRRTAAERHS
jgi:drug/metabolite transporter (DMT)-like permease